MANQKISELTAIVTVDTSLDVLPIVDTSANTTKKISPTALKTALALDNVNNTSDANKPVSTAQQDALNAKVTGNTAIVAATKTKITYDAKGLVTAGNVLDAADMPTAIDAAKIGAGAVSSTEFGYLDGVTSAIQTQIDAKQATLVSATNIKTINSTSLLGAGDITISASPSGVSGAIQFSNGSAFASDAANFFWDDTNNRLGVGTSSPTDPLSVTGTSFFTQSTGNPTLTVKNTGNGSFNAVLDIFERTNGNLYFGGQGLIVKGLDSTFGGTTTTLGARVGIKGSGSTSATTSLLVQNNAGTTILSVNDAGNATIGGTLTTGGDITTGNILIGKGKSTGIYNTTIGNGPLADGTGSSTISYTTAIGRTAGYSCASGLHNVIIGSETAQGTTAVINSVIIGSQVFGRTTSAISNTLAIGTGNVTTYYPTIYATNINTDSPNVRIGNNSAATAAVPTAPTASAIFELSSTATGFLPPRMTTTQKNAIASPAAGLIVYDNTTNKLQCYNGSTWNDLF